MEHSLKPKNVWAYRAAVISAAILWGFNSTYVRILNSCGLESAECVLIRQGTAALVIGLYLLLFRREMFKIRLKDVWCFFGSGVCSILVCNLSSYTAITRFGLPLSVASVLMYTAPAIVTLLSVPLFKEKLTAVKLISLSVMMLGCLFVTGIIPNGFGGTPVGVLLGLLSGFGYAMYTVFSRFAIRRGYQSWTITFYSFLFSATGASFFADFGNLARVYTGELAGRAILGALAVGILGCAAPYLLYTLGLRGVENGVASVMATAEPVMATVCGAVFFRETLSVPCILGIVLVLSAILFMSVGESLLNRGKAK